MFIPRMWFDEVERIGKQRCTLVGYALQGVGELIGFVGLLMLPAMPVYLVYRGVAGSFEWSLLWLLPLPLVLGIVGSIVVAFSWWLASLKKFHYDYARRESSWLEAGERRTYLFTEWQTVVGRR
jgi:4-amino-4-deoxy-L-arabinose transferase-like glycosyltransferase